MDPLVGQAMIQGGSSLLSTLAGQIFGSKDPDRIKRFISYLTQRMGQDVISSGEQANISNRLYQSRMPEMNKYAESVNKRLGLDSGLAQQALATNMASQRYGTDAELALLNKRLTSQRDLSYMNSIAGLEGALYGG